MRAVIVAGGFGTRARSLTGSRIPKALLPVAGVPTIFRQMRVLRREGIEFLTVLGGHLGNDIRTPLAKEAAELGLQFELIIEEQPLGTAGCLTNIAPPADDTLVVYGDMLFDIALSRFARYHVAHSAVLTLLVHPNDHPRTSDLISERDGLVTGVFPKDTPRSDDLRNLVPTGIYLASPAFFKHLTRGQQADIIHDVLPVLLRAGKRVAAYKSTEYIRDVGSPRRHAAAERDIEQGLVEALNADHRRPAVFFDVDGVLSFDCGERGTLTPSDVRLIESAARAVAAARGAGLITVAISNRPQIARGDINLEDLDRIFGRLDALLAESGSMLDRIYFCPHHPDGGFPGEITELKIRCDCRKPSPGLILSASHDLPIDPARSAMIGDSLRDIGAARAAGVWAYGVRTGHGCKDCARYPMGADAAPTPDLMFDDVAEAVEFCTTYRRIAAPILDRIEHRLGAEKFVVGLCGRSRTGKSCLGHALTRSLVESGRTCLHVRLDDWTVPAAQRRPGNDAQQRNRVNMLASVLAALRNDRVVVAPGYNAIARNCSRQVEYDPRGRSVVIIDGLFACHHTIRSLLDYAVFVMTPIDRQRQRFLSLYRWKGIDEVDSDALWSMRESDEWSSVDAQKSACDMVLSEIGDHE